MNENPKSPKRTPIAGEPSFLSDAPPPPQPPPQPPPPQETFTEDDLWQAAEYVVLSQRGKGGPVTRERVVKYVKARRNS